MFMLLKLSILLPGVIIEVAAGPDGKPIMRNPATQKLNPRTNPSSLKPKTEVQQRVVKLADRLRGRVALGTLGITFSARKFRCRVQRVQGLGSQFRVQGLGSQFRV